MTYIAQMHFKIPETLPPAPDGGDLTGFKSHT